MESRSFRFPGFSVSEVRGKKELEAILRNLHRREVVSQFKKLVIDGKLNENEVETVVNRVSQLLVNLARGDIEEDIWVNLFRLIGSAGLKGLWIEQRRELRDLLFTIGKIHGKKRICVLLRSFVGGFQLDRIFGAREYAVKIELATVATALDDNDALRLLTLSLNPGSWLASYCTYIRDLRVRAIVGLGEAYELATDPELMDEIERSILTLKRFLHPRLHAFNWTRAPSRYDCRCATETIAKLKEPPEYMLNEFRKGNLRAAPALANLGQKGFEALLKPFEILERRVTKSITGAVIDLLILTAIPIFIVTLLLLSIVLGPESILTRSFPHFMSLSTTRSIFVALFIVFAGASISSIVAWLWREKLLARCRAAFPVLKQVTDSDTRADQVLEKMQWFFYNMWEPTGGSFRGLLVVLFCPVLLILPLHQPCFRAIKTNEDREEIVDLLENIVRNVPMKEKEVLSTLSWMMDYLYQHEAFPLFTGAIDTISMLGGRLPGLGSYGRLKAKIQAAITDLQVCNSES